MKSAFVYLYHFNAIAVCW